MNQEYETIRKILNAATADAGRLEDAVSVLKEYANSKVQEALENVLLTEPNCQP